MPFKHLIFYLMSFFYCLQGFSQTPQYQKNDSLAQAKSELFKEMTPEQYKNFQLPPLQTLLESALSSPQVEISNTDVEIAQYDLKLEKRRWMSYLSARAGYNYGILGTYVDHETELQPLTTTYSGSSQSSWSVGANLSIPIHDLVNRGVMVKRQRKLLEQSQYNKTLTENMIKTEVVDLYFNILAALKVVKLRAETLVLYDVNYKISENDFINGKVSPQDLATLKYSQQKAIEEYETLRAGLNTMLYKLELLTNYKLNTDK